MVTFFSEILQLAVDCVADLGSRRLLVCGWAMAPRGMPLDLRVLAGPELRPVFRLLYPRPDVVPGDPDAALVTGFTLVVEDVPPTAPLDLALGGGGRVSLRHAAISRDLAAVLGSQDGAVNFRLLRAAQDRGAALPLLDWQYRPHGAFAAWLPRLALAAPRAEGLGLLAEVQASASAAGEAMLGIRFAGRPARRMQVEMLAIGALRAADGGPDDLQLLPLADPIVYQAASFAACYGRVAADVLPRLRGLELIAEVTFDEETTWLRCRPAEQQVPRFLDGIAVLPGPLLDSSLGAALLEQVLARREAALKPAIDQLARLAPRPDDQPALAVMVGVDDPVCIPLLEVLAERLEARCEALMLIGKRADQAVQVFQRRGRLAATTESDAGLALGRAAARGASVVALDPTRLGEAVIDDRLDALFDERLAGSDLDLLRGLHAAAGCSGDLADSLQRLLRLRGGGPWQPPQHGWTSPLAAHPVNAHLERMWSLPPRDAADAG